LATLSGCAIYSSNINYLYRDAKQPRAHCSSGMPKLATS
jgi:hypothetical protein